MSQARGRYNTYDMQTTWTGVALLAAVCAVAYAGEDDRVRYDGAQVYRVTGVSDYNIDQLVQFEEDGGE